MLILICSSKKKSIMLALARQINWHAYDLKKISSLEVLGVVTTREMRYHHILMENLVLGLFLRTMGAFWPFIPVTLFFRWRFPSASHVQSCFPDDNSKHESALYVLYRYSFLTLMSKFMENSGGFVNSRIIHSIVHM